MSMSSGLPGSTASPLKLQFPQSLAVYDEYVVGPSSRMVDEISGHRFKSFGEEELDFAWVESGPLVRSSYHAGKQYEAASLRLAQLTA